MTARVSPFEMLQPPALFQCRLLIQLWVTKGTAFSLVETFLSQSATQNIMASLTALRYNVEVVVGTLTQKILIAQNGGHWIIPL